MEAILNREPWWSLLLRGLFILILGILAFAWPGITLAVLMIFFGAFVLVDGIFAVVISVRKRKDYKHWWLMLLGGLVGIVVGILIFFGPLVMALVMFYLIAAWFLVIGIIRIVTAIKARTEIPIGLPVTLGILSVCFGVAIFIIPIPMLLAMFWLIAAFAIIIGIFLIVTGIQTKKLSKATS
jgi:uncharacterized membrane protein HdeD (DUF308 family)